MKETMETTTINNYQVNTYRKNTPKFVQRLRDRACHLLSQGDSIKTVYDTLRQHLKDIEYIGSIYITLWAASDDYNKKDSLSISNSTGDYTLVSIIPEKENEKCHSAK